MYERILAAIDLTPNENAVLQHAEHMARAFGATVHLLHVARTHLIPGDIVAGAGLGVPSGDDDVDPDDREMMDVALARLAASGVTATGEVLYGLERDIADTILHRAKDLEVSLLVIGEPSHGGVAGIFRARIADEVVRRHTAIPILLVP
jgi:nucleotide-binding universal stress UspA family protein